MVCKVSILVFFHLVSFSLKTELVKRQSTDAKRDKRCWKFYFIKFIRGQCKNKLNVYRHSHCNAFHSSTKRYAMLHCVWWHLVVFKEKKWDRYQWILKVWVSVSMFGKKLRYHSISQFNPFGDCMNKCMYVCTCAGTSDPSPFGYPCWCH